MKINAGGKLPNDLDPYCAILVSHCSIRRLYWGTEYGSYIQGRDRFIRYDQQRIWSQHAGNRKPLPLSPTKFVGHRVLHAWI